MTTQELHSRLSATLCASQHLRVRIVPMLLDKWNSFESLKDYGGKLGIICCLLSLHKMPELFVEVEPFFEEIYQATK